MSDVKVTKCPPGVAYGALGAWPQRVSSSYATPARAIQEILDAGSDVGKMLTSGALLPATSMFNNRPTRPKKRRAK